MSLVDSLIGDVLPDYPVLGIIQRSFATIFPDVTVEEVGRDTTEIVDQPVETGSTISDHAFDMPAELEARYGFSNSSAQAEGYVQEIYAEILSIKQQRVPFQVVTGKRTYDSMLIKSMTQTTDVSSEFALNITISFRRLNLVSTQMTGSGSTQSTSDPISNAYPTVNSDPAQQGNPATTLAVSPAGTIFPTSSSSAPGFASYLPTSGNLN